MKRRLRGYLMTAVSVGGTCLMLIGLQPAIHEYLHAVGLERVYAAEQDILTRDLSKTILERVRSSQRDSNVKGRTGTLSGDGSSLSGTDDNAVEDVCVYEADAEGDGTVAEGTAEDSWQTVEEPVSEWVYYGNCRITHYDAGPCCCGEWATGCTASGVLATTHHTVATGDDLPFGTELLINGEVYVVEDRGVDPYCVDIFVEDHLQALELGMYYTDVYMRY